MVLTISFLTSVSETFQTKFILKKVPHHTVSKKYLYIFLPYLGKLSFPARSKFQCSSCNATYYGKTKRHFKVRVSGHVGVSARTGKNIKSTKNSAVRDHMLVCNNIVSFEDFSVLANGTNDFRIKLQESLLIHRDGPQLNKTSESAPLMLLLLISDY